MNEERMSLPLSVINDTLKYLGTRPYIEVSQLVASIHTMVKPIEVLKKESGAAISGGMMEVVEDEDDKNILREAKEYK